MSGVEEIAARLTEAQKRALIYVGTHPNPYGVTAGSADTSSRNMRILEAMGLLIGGRVYGGCVSFIETDTGAKVRAHLKGEG